MIAAHGIGRRVQSRSMPLPWVISGPIIFKRLPLTLIILVYADGLLSVYPGAGLRHQPLETSMTADLRTLCLAVDDLAISSRARRCLTAVDIRCVGDLIQMNEKNLLYIRNFGKRSLAEIKRELATMGLRLGTELTDWPPQDVGEMHAKFASPEMLDLRR